MNAASQIDAAVNECLSILRDHGILRTENVSCGVGVLVDWSTKTWLLESASFFKLATEFVKLVGPIEAEKAARAARRAMVARKLVGS